MADLTLIILAAGIGSRYGGLKQLDPVGPSGEFIVDYSVFDAVRAGFERVVFVIRDGMEEAFRETIGRRIAAQVQVDYVHQRLSPVAEGFTVPPDRMKPWGTGHAVLTCAQVVSGPFAVINADDFYGSESYGILGRFLTDTKEDDAGYAMVAYPLRNTLSEHGSVARGICSVDGTGHLAGVVERTDISLADLRGEELTPDTRSALQLTGSEPASMNFWGFKPSLFGHLQPAFARFLSASAHDPTAEFFLPTVVNELIAAGTASVRVLETGAAWFGATYSEDRPRVVARIRDMVENGDYPDTLWARNGGSR